jgi:ATP-dependent RNA helicase DDX60
MHAVHSMERLLDEMLRRSAIFDIIFFEGKLIVISKRFIPDCLIWFSETRHLTLKGGTDYAVSSRSLARTILFNYLVEHSSEMGLEIHAFSSLMDPAWIAYQQRTKVSLQIPV